MCRQGRVEMMKVRTGEGCSVRALELDPVRVAQREERKRKTGH